MILEDCDENSYPEIIEEYFGGDFDKDDKLYYTKVNYTKIIYFSFLSFLDFCKMVW